VPIIRRNNCIYATLGICYSVWMTVWYAGWVYSLVSMDYLLYILQILHTQGSTYKLHFATCIITEPEGIPGDFDDLNTLTHWHTQTSPRRPGSLGPLTLRRRIKSHLLFAGIIRSSPFSPR